MVHYTTGLQRHCWYADRWRTKTKATTGAEPHAGLRALVQEQESTHVFRHHLSNHVLAEVWTVRVLYLHFWSGLVQPLDSVRDRDGHALTLPLLVLSNKIASFFYFFFFFFYSLRCEFISAKLPKVLKMSLWTHERQSFWMKGDRKYINMGEFK